MALEIEHFVRLRPYLYHLTGRNNIKYIQQEMILKPPNILYAESGEINFRGTHRRGHRFLTNGRQIRDQDPLHSGNISFSGGWGLKDLITHLDEHVFFWPGWEHGPIQSGKNHFQRYAGEKPIILRVKTREILDENIMLTPLFCKYNSGAPRCTKGKGSPRGPETFLPAAEFPFPPTNIIEVTYRSSVSLPAPVQVISYPNDNWQELRKVALNEL